MRKKQTVIEQKIDNELLIIPVIDGVAQMKQVCCLSKTGMEIWEMLSNIDDISEEQIISNMATKYKISASEIKNDILEFLEMMKKQGIVY